MSESTLALFKNFHGPEPVYHRWQPGGLNEEGRWVAYTGCGRPFYYDGKRLMTFLPMRHAVKFARPCKQCWPGG